ncbi:hypothetical protein SS50377_26477 [Spironucleus salmonicida]|uniref:Uncharacterized protein n=1 Tax=Spironucleus salmonicida TaxID=348837 RepID=V6LA84_9EUKA|nr:hypothetical protein SS50377_26477 [Spironucleus salmonicida]|eukprot:EST41335.1 Hypothetical protein SS50377_19048 [Spironucleus salmonicida]
MQPDLPRASTHQLNSLDAGITAIDVMGQSNRHDGFCAELTGFLSSLAPCLPQMSIVLREKIPKDSYKNSIVSSVNHFVDIDGPILPMRVGGEIPTRIDSIYQDTRETLSEIILPIAPISTELITPQACAKISQIIDQVTKQDITIETPETLKQITVPQQSAIRQNAQPPRELEQIQQYLQLAAVYQNSYELEAARSYQQAREALERGSESEAVGYLYQRRRVLGGLEKLATKVRELEAAAEQYWSAELAELGRE